MKNNKINVRKMVVTALLSAVAAILMFLDFPVPMIIPSFIKMDFSELPALIAAFSLGPWWGAVVCFIKNLINVILHSSATAGIGELANFLLGAVFAVVAGYIYQYKKTKKTAVVASVIGAFVMAIISLPINYYITYPAYSLVLSMEAIVGMYSAILPAANTLFKALLFFNVPFTLLKGVLTALIAMLIYKPLSPIIKGKNL